MMNKRYLKLGLILLSLFTTACSKPHQSKSPNRSNSAVVHKTVQKNSKQGFRLAKTKSKVEKGQFYSQSLHRNWYYAIYLPAGYAKKLKQNIPVLYMMHGVYGKYDNMLEYGNSKAILDHLMTGKTKKRMAVVYVDGFDSFYVNQKHGMQMETAIIKDLLPFIQKKYHLASSATGNCIGGISMGGYGAARLALKYPQKFAYADLISPAVWSSLPATNPIRQHVSAFQDQGQHWSDKRYQSLFPTKYLNNKSRNVQFFVETTDTDTTVPVKDVDIFVKRMRKQQVKVKYLRDHGDNHGWTYWKKALPNAYRWALNKLNQ